MERSVEKLKSLPGRARLRQALLADWSAGRFHLEYQPQVNLRRGTISRFEALLRWEGNEGRVPPKDFIPLAEEIGLIGQISQWVLERACLDAVTWPEEIGLAVNITADALQDSGLPAIVQHALAQSGLAASRLELEITETAPIVADAECLRILDELRALGVRLIIDDLDIGHASLRYLLDFTFDKIKLDGLYTASLGRPGRRGEAAWAIMRSVAALCQTLKIDSLAEGVETVEQLGMVMRARFTEVQGFIFGVPVAAESVHEVILHMRGLWNSVSVA